MPLVFASRSEKVDDALYQKVRDALLGIIAKHLDVPENPMARLVPVDIEVKHLGSPFDITHFDVEVTILATKFEARIETGQLRSDAIQLELEAMLPEEMTCFVWLVLVDAFFSASVLKKEPRKLRVMLLESDLEARREIERDLLRAGVSMHVEETPEDLGMVLDMARSVRPHVVIMGWHRFGTRFLIPLKDICGQVWIYTADSEKDVRNGGGWEADRVIDKFGKARLADLLKEVQPI